MTRRKKQPCAVMILKGIPQDIKDKFHISCLKNHISMKQVVQMCMAHLGEPVALETFLEHNQEKGAET